MADFEGVPEDYSAEDVTSAVRATVTQVNDELQEIREMASAPVQVAPLGFPDYTNVRELRLEYNLAGTYGGDSDPRVARVSSHEGDGIVSGSPYQRFRFPAGTHVAPLMLGPVASGKFGSFNGGVVVVQAAYAFMFMGVFVTGIRHDLGRLPEWVVGRSSATLKGPAGQLIQIDGGAEASPYAVGTNVRADMDFVPILGREPKDIERMLKHLVGLGDGTSTVSEHAFSPFGFFAAAANNNYENPDLLARYASDLVTTKERFGGLLILTVSGLSSLQAASGGASVAGQSFGCELWTASLQDPVTAAQDGMCNAHLPGLGKGIYSMNSTNATRTLQQWFDQGFRMALKAGSVDFIMG